jgi:NADH dehydrogenase (ubiquinone) 1 alpha subcomplex subunit 5
MMLARAARRPQLLVQRAAPSMARRAISLGALAPARFARATTPLLDARRQATTKTTTGIVGLPVDPHARETLIALNEKLLDEIKAVPQSAEYRKSVEATCNYRLKCLRENEDEATLEELIGMGQLEELIESQTEELGVLRMYVAVWKSKFTARSAESLRRPSRRRHTQVRGPGDVEGHRGARYARVQD